MLLVVCGEQCPRDTQIAADGLHRIQHFAQVGCFAGGDRDGSAVAALAQRAARRRRRGNRGRGGGGVATSDRGGGGSESYAIAGPGRGGRRSGQGGDAFGEIDGEGVKVDFGLFKARLSFAEIGGTRFLNVLEAVLVGHLLIFAETFEPALKVRSGQCCEKERKAKCQTIGPKEE